MLRGSLLLALRFTVAAAPRVSAQAPDDNFDRLFARALELQQAGDTLGAIDTYKAALGLA